MTFCQTHDFLLTDEFPVCPHCLKEEGVDFISTEFGLYINAIHHFPFVETLAYDGSTAILKALNVYLAAAETDLASGTDEAVAQVLSEIGQIKSELKKYLREVASDVE